MAYVQLEDKIATGRARQRYLNNMAKIQQEGSIDEDDRTCILCRCDFLRGFITPWYVVLTLPLHQQQLT